MIYIIQRAYSSCNQVIRIIHWACLQNDVPRNYCHFLFLSQKFDKKYDTGGLFISGKEVESYNFPGADAYLINRIIRLTKCSFDCSRLSQLVNGTCCRVGEGNTKTWKILSFSLLLFLIPKWKIYNFKLYWIISKNYENLVRRKRDKFQGR